MFFSKKHWAKWLRRPSLVGGIYCSSSGFTLVVVNQQKAEYPLVFAHFFMFDTHKHEANVAVSAPSDIPNDIGHIDFHVVSDAFQVLPLLLPAEISRKETIACAELKLHQQENADAWLWDVELNGQSSKLWLLAKVHYTNLVQQLQSLGVVNRQLRSWRPATKKEAQAERMAADFNYESVCEVEMNQNELVLAISAALCK